MHGESTFLRDLVVALAAALVVLLPSRRLKIPAAVGFMLTGVLIGPGALGWISDTARVGILAEIGVSVLLFIVGLEFSLARLREIGRAFLVAGPLQVVATIAAVTGVLLLLPIHARLAGAIFAGMLVTLSSTAMVMRSLGERGETHAPQGRLLVGILLFQDIAMVPMLLLVPALAAAAGALGAGALGAGGASGAVAVGAAASGVPNGILGGALAVGNGGALSLAARLLIGLAAAGVVAAAARWLMPRVVNAVIRSGVRELYVMMAVAVCLGSALLTQRLGLSPALGAFLAGLLVSESEYSHQVVSEIVPFRDLFSSLFFISIGMLLEPAFVAANLPAIGGWLFLTVALKAIVAAAIVRLMGFPLRVAAIVGISLAQVGEFSFVLASVGIRNGLLSAAQSREFFAVAVLSLVITPFLVPFGSWLGAREAARATGAGAGALGSTVPRFGGAKRRDGDHEARAGAGSGTEAGAGSQAGAGAEAGARALRDHVIVAGYGLNGRNVAHALAELGIHYVVLEMDPSNVRRARAQGVPIQFGDVSRPESLHACGAERAAVVVLAISDASATRHAVAQVRRVNPGAYIIARTRLVAEVAELRRLGADEAIPEEFETSIAIVTRVLRRYHVPGNVIRLQEGALRREGYAFLRGGDVSVELTHSIERMIAGAVTDTFFLEPGSPAVGHTLASLDLRGRTGALVIAIVREGTPRISPEADLELETGDILVLVGDHQGLESAFRILEGEKGPDAS
ncbi:MAG TPA: cation:proton antiporter [Candidatus Binatia bacterium]|nr:cation:proton antiporter [Candidatus Binatia bacterium]